MVLNKNGQTVFSLPGSTDLRLPVKPFRFVPLLLMPNGRTMPVLLMLDLIILFVAGVVLISTLISSASPTRQAMFTSTNELGLSFKRVTVVGVQYCNQQQIAPPSSDSVTRSLRCTVFNKGFLM